jgi:hypothetical protein
MYSWGRNVKLITHLQLEVKKTWIYAIVKQKFNFYSFILIDAYHIHVSASLQVSYTKFVFFSIEIRN